MRPMLLILFLLVVSTQPSSTQSAANASSLRGAWRVVEFAGAAPNAPGQKFTQPSLFIFTDRHFSFSAVSSDTPRPTFADGSKPTPEEALAIWGPFMAQSGSYQVAGTTLSVRPLVAKNPGVMAGQSSVYSFELDGDTLTLTVKENGAGVMAPVVRLVRLE